MGIVPSFTSVEGYQKKVYFFSLLFGLVSIDYDKERPKQRAFKAIQGGIMLNWFDSLFKKKEKKEMLFHSIAVWLAQCIFTQPLNDRPVLESLLRPVTSVEVLTE